MYVWIWRRLPGGLPGKLAGCTALLVGALALLFYVAFPWAEDHVPFNNVTVHEPGVPGRAPSNAPSNAPSTSATSTP